MIHDPKYSSIASREIFQGRTVLRCQEIAAALAITVCHVRDLIDEGRLAAVNIAGQPVKPGKHPAAERAQYRIPVSAYDDFISRNKTV